MSRLQALEKLARETLTQGDRARLNNALYNVQGYDYIDSILEENGFELGSNIGKDKFHLRRHGEPVVNAVLFGDYRGMQVILKEHLKVEKSKVQKNPPKVQSTPLESQIPYDAYTSPAALYEIWEREKESNED